MKRKIYTVLLHLFAWFIFLVGPLSSLFYEYSVSNEVVWLSICSILILLVVFYINYYILIPKFLFKKKFAPYFLLTIAILGGIVLLNREFHAIKRVERQNGELVLVKRENRISNPPSKENKPPHLDNAPHDEGHSPPRPPQRDELRPQRNQKPPPFVVSPIYVPGALALLLIIGIAIRTTGRWFDEDRKNKQIKAEQLKTELAFLKNQISPHFFFNTLNNIYALTESDPKQAKDITYKLSKLMRYLLYESDKNQKVSLKMEISFLENYIDLMRPRLPENMKVVTKFELERTMDQVPPLLFITFVENAFKHGVSSNNPAFIDISLTNTDGRIVFAIKNSIPKGDNLEKGIGGLGLTNIKRRLELLFDNDEYSLKIKENKEVYSVELIFTANEN